MSHVPSHDTPEDAAFLAQVMRTCDAGKGDALRDAEGLTVAGQWLVQALKGQAAMNRAAHDTELAADELRKFQKFVRPGQPSAHIVQLRQKQALARQASARSRQAFVKAAMEFARTLPLDVPPRASPETVVTTWIAAHLVD
ncbi:MAG: hypothetical protein GAK28_01922 [Luteibacter sp.]|uniref:hypothetical protein n=1 Tax=Luteibacter sp. TaxID=1886636 RepID=UPI00137F6098|nr:hypothetical protein [Luteibacter sp.]KAF1007283.1 MAG: hypothetical protein GAK28_01922 [Luteibacter sp.]